LFPAVKESWQVASPKIRCDLDGLGMTTRTSSSTSAPYEISESYITMNSTLRKLRFGSMILFLIVIAVAAAQNPAANLQEVVVPITDVELGCHPQWRNPLIIGDNLALQKALDEGSTNFCKLDRNLKIDFQKYTLILLTEFANCQAIIH